MTNEQIAKLLRNVAVSYSIKDEAKFRFQIIAYNRAADAIENMTMQVKDLFQEGKLQAIPGVGPSISDHIEELLRSGKVEHFDWVLEGIPPAVFPLLEIPSFGPKKAHKLVLQFHLKHPETVIEDVEKIAKAGKIADLAGFGKKSEEDILQAIREYKLGKSKSVRMVLPYANELAAKIIEYLQQSSDVLTAYPLGSLRRMVSTIGDVDIAVSTNNSQAVLNHFAAYPYKERILSSGVNDSSLLTSGEKRIDLRTQSPGTFGSLLQHFTGSKQHNIHLREVALKKGLSLSEYGIKVKSKDGKEKMQEFDTEEKFYKAIGLSWIPPEIREDTGEIELALKNKLPNLVKLEDIKGDFHIHSSFPIEPSHDMGRNSMEQMLKRAGELHYQYLGFSEHNPSSSKHTKDQVMQIIESRSKFIDQLKSTNKYVRILSLLEIDILPDGKLALSDEALDLLDGAIVSIHSVFSMNKIDMTKRVLSGLSHPKAKILAHPTGRLLNQRMGFELDFEKVMSFCKENNKALEINSSPLRLDLPDTLVREAVRSGIKLAINTDSHATEQMNLMKYGVSVARRGWATKSDILNTMEYNKLIAWFKD